MAFCIPAADLLTAIVQAKSPRPFKDAVLVGHRVRSVITYLDGLGAFYSDALSKAVTGMDVALTKSLDPTRAISLVRQEMTGRLQKDEAFLTDFDQEFVRVYNDVRIAESLRNRMREISKNILAMKTAIVAPEGPADSYRARASLLKEKQRSYIERLRADLATTNLP
jgi:hypothetical protein